MEGVRLPPGSAAAWDLHFHFTVLSWTVPLALLATPILMARFGVDLTSPRLLVLAIASPICGLAAAAWLPWMIGALARLDIAVAHSMLGPTERDLLGKRVSELASSRSRMVDAAEQERRRIERDLHDGAGQQLISLAMTLGMAKEKFASDPEAARALVDESHREAKQALAGLRDIVRGISPAILPIGASVPPSPRSRLARQCPLPLTSTFRNASTPGSRASPTTWCVRLSPTSRVTAAASRVSVRAVCQGARRDRDKRQWPGWRRSLARQRPCRSRRQS